MTEPSRWRDEAELDYGEDDIEHDAPAKSLTEEAEEEGEEEGAAADAGQTASPPPHQPGSDAQMRAEQASPAALGNGATAAAGGLVPEEWQVRGWPASLARVRMALVAVVIVHSLPCRIAAARHRRWADAAALMPPSPLPHPHRRR